MDILLEWSNVCECPKFRSMCIFWVDGKMTVGISSEIERTYSNYTKTSQLKIHINEMHYNSYPYVEVRSIANGDGKWWDLLDFQLWLRVSVFGCCSDTNRMINWKLIFGIDLCCDNKFSGHFRCVWQIELNWSGLLMTNDANATTWWK